MLECFNTSLMIPQHFRLMHVWLGLFPAKCSWVLDFCLCSVEKGLENIFSNVQTPAKVRNRVSLFYNAILTKHIHVPLRSSYALVSGEVILHPRLSHKTLLLYSNSMKDVSVALNNLMVPGHPWYTRTSPVMSFCVLLKCSLLFSQISQHWFFSFISQTDVGSYWTFLPLAVCP